MASIRELWRYPIKSVGGERLVGSASVTDLGIIGDRGWGVFDTETSTVLTARRTPELLFARAAVVAGGGAPHGEAAVQITLPDESVLTSADGDATNSALSAWLGRAVELRRAGDEGGTYEVPLDFENDAEWVSWQGPGGAWHDSPRHRLSLVSLATMGQWDARRFRANVILDGDGEDDLVGGSVRVGAATLEVTKPIDRCVIVTRPQPGLERDLDVLRTINKERATFLAVGALVTTPGTMREGDKLKPVG